MLNQYEAMERLRKEREYEDRLVEYLTKFFLASLGDITDITEEERDKVKEHLDTIRSESRHHSFLFNDLLQRVLDGGEGDY